MDDAGSKLGPLFSATTIVLGDSRSRLAYSIVYYILWKDIRNWGVKTAGLAGNDSEGR